MAQTKKTGQAKNAGTVAKNASTKPETVEQVKDTTQEPETAEADQDATQEPETAEADQDATQEPETAEADQDATQEPETAEADQDDDQEPDVFANLPNPCVYCGPSVKGVARQYTTYQGGGIPDALREFIKANPDALGLIVSTRKFPAMRKRLETQGTQEAKLYRAVKARL